jgi:hypothetical protein
VAIVILLLHAAHGHLSGKVYNTEDDRLDVQYQGSGRYLYLHRVSRKQDDGDLFITCIAVNGLCQTAFFNCFNYFDVRLYRYIIYLSVYNSVQASKK